MPDDVGEKTEQATEHRRAETRRQGNVARSVDLNSAFMMFATAIVLYFSGAEFVQSMGSILKTHLAERPFLTRTTSPESVGKFAWEVVKVASRPTLFMMMFLAATAVFMNLLQFGWMISPEAIQPQWGRVSPAGGLKRIFSIGSVVKLLVSLGKLLVLVGVTLAFGIDVIPLSARTAGFHIDASSIGSDIGEVSLELAFLLAIVLLVLGVLDYAYQKWKHERDMMMTREEVREEMKMLEGDAEIRQRRKDAHRKIASSEELQQAATADVVVTNPTHYAIAIKYDPEIKPAPYVVAKGMDHIAMRIREVAAEHGIPILERKQLARALYRDVRVGQMVPAELYDVFVQIMAYVYQISNRPKPKLD